MKARKHFVITRFNVGLYRRFAKRPGAADAWVKKRIPIFRKYTVGSLLNQSCRNFKFIVLVDAKTPTEHMVSIEDSCQLDTNIITVEWDINKRPSERVQGVEQWRDEFVRIVGNSCRQAIMTRVDNDDALHCDFVKTVQNYVADNRGEYCFDFLYGYMHDTKTKETWLASHKPGSPFITRIESVHHDMGTVYETYHSGMPGIVETVVAKRPPAWMMVIHGNNWTNRMFDHMKVAERDFEKIRKDFGL